MLTLDVITIGRRLVAELSRVDTSKETEQRVLNKAECESKNTVQNGRM